MWALVCASILPIGPLRIDYGIPLQKDGNSSDGQIQLQRRLSILNECCHLRSNDFPTTLTPCL